jgi:hypothetical protein
VAAIEKVNHERNPVTARTWRQGGTRAGLAAAPGGVLVIVQLRLPIRRLVHQSAGGRDIAGRLLP